MSLTARKVMLNICARQIVQLERRRFDLEGATLNTDPSEKDQFLDASIERQLRFWQDMTTRYQEAQPA